MIGRNESEIPIISPGILVGRGSCEQLVFYGVSSGSTCAAGADPLLLEFRGATEELPLDNAISKLGLLTC